MYALAANRSVVCMCMSPGGLQVNHVSLDALEAAGYRSAHEYMSDVFDPTVVIPCWGVIAQSVPISRLAPFTCVEMARAILGIDRQMWTPRALYRYLVSNRLRKDLLAHLNLC